MTQFKRSQAAPAKVEPDTAAPSTPGTVPAAWPSGVAPLVRTVYRRDEAGERANKSKPNARSDRLERGKRLRG